MSKQFVGLLSKGSIIVATCTIMKHATSLRQQEKPKLWCTQYPVWLRAQLIIPPPHKGQCTRSSQNVTRQEVLMGPWKPGNSAIHFQHHLLVSYLALNRLFAFRSRPAATCPFLQDKHGPHWVQGPSVTNNKVDTSQWHCWNLPNSLLCWDI